MVVMSLPHAVMTATKTLHLTPSCSAAGSLIQALERVGKTDEVAWLPDDLSCGPIDPVDPEARAAWWDYSPDEFDVGRKLISFWNRIAKSDDRIVIWFGRRSAKELAFFLALADRLGDRPYSAVDVTGMQHYFIGRDGSSVLSKPAQAVSMVRPEGLIPLLDSYRPITVDENEEAARQWRELARENSAFRIVTSMGLSSAPIDCFDALILERTSHEWRKAARVIGDAFGYNCDLYIQVGDEMLLARLVALVETRCLIAEGDPWDMHACQVRRPYP